MFEVLLGVKHRVFDVAKLPSDCPKSYKIYELPNYHSFVILATLGFEFSTSNINENIIVWHKISLLYHRYYQK